MYDPLGLSIGTTNLVAARHGSSPVTRRAVLTLYPHRAPKVGVCERDSDPAGRGVLMSGFVQRVGTSATLVSSDGSAHDPDLLMVEALDAMVVATGADASSSEISIAVPAYWKPATVQALRNGLRTHVGFVRSGMAPRLVSDAIAAATAVNAELGLPDEGVVGVLDFGGTGTSVTLVKTKGDLELASATMRYADFSGDEVDQALLLHVFEEVGHSGDADPEGTAAVGQLAALREECRAAKERLSAETVTELTVDLPGCGSTLHLTRDRLEDLIQDRLTGFIYAFDQMMARSKAGWADLSALVTVGGGAGIPLITERLSLHTRRPVLTVAQPALAAAMGALALAARGEHLNLRTRTSLGLLAASAAGTRVVELASGDVMVIDADAMTDRELAWSQTEYPGDLPMQFAGDAYNEDGPAGWSMRLNIIEPPPKAGRWRRFRLSQLLIGLSAVVAMIAIGGVAFTLAAIENREAPVVPSVTPAPTPSSLAPSSVVPTPVPPPPSATPVPSAEPVPSSVPPAPPSPSPPPPPPVATTVAPPPVVTTTRPRYTSTTPPPPSTTTTTVPPPAATTTPPPPSTTTTTTTTVPMTTEWIHVPLLPLPIPVPVPQSQVPQYPNGGNFQNPFQNGTR